MVFQRFEQIMRCNVLKTSMEKAGLHSGAGWRIGVIGVVHRLSLGSLSGGRQ